MAYESISTMRFQTTPKGDLTDWLFIFRKPEPLGMEWRYLMCSRLGGMLYLEIQKGEEATKSSGFQK